MTAAIYARKSTEQRGDPEAKSVTTQIENAKAFAAGKGWTVDPASTPTMASAAPRRTSWFNAGNCWTSSAPVRPSRC